MLQRNEKAQKNSKAIKSYLNNLLMLALKRWQKSYPEFVNGKPAEAMDLFEASIRFQMFAGLDPVGPKEMVSKIKFEELKNRFAEKNVDQNEKLREHFNNLVYSAHPGKNKDAAEVKKAFIKSLKKVESLLP